MFNFASLYVLLFSLLIYYLIINFNATTQVNMANNGILLVSNVAKAHKYCTKVSKYVKKILYLSFSDGPDNTLSVINKQNIDIYSKSSQYSNLDVRLILKPRESFKRVKTNHPVDVILYNSEVFQSGDNIIDIVENTRNKNIEKIQLQDLDEHLHEPVKEEAVKTYEYVALGGTFDRLHNGHKILLSQAVLRATKHVTVGVTDLNMIKSKILWELIEPVEKRIKNVLDFLTDINPDLEYTVLPIQDVYGPTKDDPKYQLIVVSEETVRGSVKINEKRKENNLQPLDTYIIPLAEDGNKQSSFEETKVSSSNHRMRLLGTLLKEPTPNPNIPKWPYVIGVTGGIASGKSNILEKLKLKGVPVINCDIIAHELYQPGLPLNRTISETFGSHVITAHGEVDRKKLGQIVFNDKAQMEKLNKMMWPAMLVETQRRIKALGDDGARVVVMEAAVMIQAQWYRYCHQLWAVIVPPEEAVKRLQERNNLTEEQARQRVEAQPTNLQQVAVANIVFSPYWSYEYTQNQIDRAWEHLTKILADRN